jgi:prepilin-type N-terminal cleavage/methylation domain-containing protein
MHKGKNNKGLTLVELIVAVAILAIIVLPLLKAFVISAGTNAKAKEKLRTTELAQNIMEGLEAADLSNLTYQFCNSGTDNCDFTLLTGQKQMTVSQMDTDTDGVYCFAMKDLTASEKKYDALITISANQETAENGTKNNADEVVNISRIDTGHDALSVPSKTADDIMTAIWKQYPDVPQSDISRTITVSIETVSGVSDPYQRVTVSYQYNWKKNGIDYVFPSGASSNLYSDVLFENAGAADRSLSNVYLFFYPWYTSTQGNLSDTIIISNTSDQDVAVYLVKQESNAANLETLETGYRVTVNVKEPYVSAADTGTNTVVRTNLNTNLVTGTDADQAIWSLNDEIADAAKKITRKALSAKEAQDRLYDVTVSIYPSGAYDSKFKDSDAITTLTGGMLN